MSTKEEIQKAEQRAKLRAQMDRMKQETVARAQLNMLFDATIKTAMQKAYGRNLTRIFEEMALERLKRDGFIDDDEKAS